MNSDVVIDVENVSKKFCKSLKRSMVYGISDIARNLLGIKSPSTILRTSEFWAVDDVSFQVKRGETLGLIGKNGSGKTTMLKMLNGIFWPDKGKISIKGRVGALIAVGAGFHPMLSGRENIYLNASILGMKKREINKRFDAIVEFADIGDFLDTPVKFYSSGMFVRLGFAVAVHCDPEVLLVDEVLAVGDSGFQSKCFNKIGELAQKNVATVLVSHNMHHISTFSDRVVFLNSGMGYVYDDIGEGINAYNALFEGRQSTDVEFVSSGNQSISFKQPDGLIQTLMPQDNFNIDIPYESQQDYDNVELDIVIYAENSPGLYFQATNHLYHEAIALIKGKHVLRLQINNIPINNSTAKICFALWTQNRQEKLLWWRIPVKFKSVPLSTGKNVLKVNFFYD
jgi:lipopolysaccharide transport system ATP-binding protein